MSDFSLVGGGADCLEAGFDYSATLPTIITGSATSNEVGAYVELLSAASNDAPSAGVIVTCKVPVAATQGDIFINIAIGDAGSEQDIISNLWLPSQQASEIGTYVFNFPISVPSGVRISANLQGSTTAKTYGVNLSLVRGSLNANSLRVVDTIGANLATTDGVTVNTSATINTFGSWTEITPLAPEAYKGFIVAAHKVDGSMSDMNQTYQIALGSSGNEEVIYSGHTIRPTSIELVVGSISPFIPVSIASGVRISARVQSTSTNADGNLDFVIYGIR